MPFWKREQPADKKPEDEKPNEPNYVTKDELQSFSNDIKESILSLREQRLEQPASEPKREELPAIDDVDDDTYEGAIIKLQDPDFDGDRRDLLKVIRKREKANEERRERNFSAKLDAVRQESSEHISRLNTQSAQAALQTKPHYELLKKDIDAAMAQLPAAQRTPEAANFVYNQIVGMNIDKIDEHRQRQADEQRRKQADLDAPSRRGQRQEKPSFASTFGEQFADDRANIGLGGPIWNPNSRLHRDADDFARNPQAHAGESFQNADEYAEYAQAVMSIEACPRCLMEIINDKCNCAAINKFSNKRDFFA